MWHYTTWQEYCPHPLHGMLTLSPLSQTPSTLPPLPHKSLTNQTPKIPKQPPGNASEQSTLLQGTKSPFWWENWEVKGQLGSSSQLAYGCGREGQTQLNPSQIDFSQLLGLSSQPKQTSLHVPTNWQAPVLATYRYSYFYSHYSYSLSLTVKLVQFSIFVLSISRRINTFWHMLKQSFCMWLDTCWN